MTSPVFSVRRVDIVFKNAILLQLRPCQRNKISSKRVVIVLVVCILVMCLGNVQIEVYARSAVRDIPLACIVKKEHFKSANRGRQPQAVLDLPGVIALADQFKSILTKAYNALDSGGAILIMEALYDDDKTGPIATTGIGMVMMACFDGGKQRSAHEMTQLLEKHGFVDVQVKKSGVVHSAILAKKM
uniref:Uncharacterized protein LOC102807722 n=1 Tax=Saccoglossus kowalevskii TaxID=10224 RepID=A0ABM0N0Y2_SACKO|nr:PREDICTED: uncharacterized protein LOC102807722 [Saccoglossus kowalevskii]